MHSNRQDDDAQKLALRSRLIEAVELHRRGQLPQARAIYESILETQPAHFDAMHLLGVVAMESGKPQEAVDLIERAIRINPSSAVAYSNLGNALQEIGQLEAAVASYDKAIGIKPDFSDAHFNRGNALHKLDRWDDAVGSYDKALHIDANRAEVHCNRGNALMGLKLWDAALASYDAALNQQPDFAQAHSNRGNALRELKRFEAALASQDEAIRIEPDYADAHYNRGLVLREQMQLDAAIASYDNAIRINPELVEAQWNRSLALLLTGDFEKGWPSYEWRWKRPALMHLRRNFSQALWLGDEPLKNKTILLHCEQGLGDTIMLIRLVRFVAAQGARVIVEAPKALIGLLKQLDCVTEWVQAGGDLPAFDFHCPLLSLPLALGTSLSTIPDSRGYLRPDRKLVGQWAETLGAKTRPRVGLVWSGSSQHRNDRQRSMALSALLPRLPDGFEYISLHKDVRDCDSATLAVSPRVRHFGSAIKDFTDTAALCELMDLVISVDTSVAHLSAALGKPTWVLLPYLPDWRWLLDRGDSPWYASVRLYRQAADRVWAGVLDKLSADLLRLRASPERLLTRRETDALEHSALARGMAMQQQGHLKEARAIYGRCPRTC